MPPQGDPVRVLHMLESARAALRYATGKTRTDLDTSPMLVDAIVRRTEIIGEAARSVSDATRALAPEIPWRVIVAMRNFLVHAYDVVDLDRLWQTIESDLGPLIVALEALLSKIGGPPPP